MARVGGCVAEMRRSTTEVVTDAQGAPWKLDRRCESSRLMEGHAAREAVEKALGFVLVCAQSKRYG